MKNKKSMGAAPTTTTLQSAGQSSSILQTAAGGSGIGVALGVGIPLTLSEVSSIGAIGSEFTAEGQVGSQISAMNSATAAYTAAQGQEANSITSQLPGFLQSLSILAFQPANQASAQTTALAANAVNPALVGTPATGPLNWEVWGLVIAVGLVLLEVGKGDH